jgi:hypothetical protein
VKRLRINLACQILMSDERASITGICYEVGYNNLSNFNRQFLAEKGMTPSRFRRLLLENINMAKAAKEGVRGTGFVHHEPSGHAPEGGPTELSGPPAPRTDRWIRLSAPHDVPA